MKTFLFLIPLLSCFCAYSQEPALVRELTERVIDYSGSVSDASDVALQINEWLQNPIDLNNCNASDLEPLFFLNPLQVSSILKHRTTYGPFLNIFELQAVQGLDQQTAILLSNFVQIDNRRNADYLKLNDLIRQSKMEVQITSGRDQRDSETLRAYRNYSGGPWQQRVRIRGTSNDRLWFGVGMEKDPGEPWGSFGDFQTAHLLWKGINRIRAVAIGDYQLQFGMGLTAGNGFYAGKSAAVFNTVPAGIGFRPSRSFNETGFLRGAAMTIEFRKWRIDPWFSLSPSSSTIDTVSSETDRMYVLSTSGYHRTPAERNRQNNTRNLYTGFHVGRQTSNGKMGMLASVYGTEKAGGNPMEWMKHAVHPVLGGYHMGNLKKAQIACEVTFSVGGGAFVYSVLMPVNVKTELMLLYRNYQTGFQNPYANAWSNFSKPGNETGWYLSFQHRWKKNRLLSGYADFYKSPGPRYLAFMPSNGGDFLLEYLLPYSKSVTLKIRGRIRQGQQNITGAEPTKQMGETLQRQFRVDLTRVFSTVTLHCRVEFIDGHNSSGQRFDGLLSYEELRFKAGLFNIKLRYLQRVTSGSKCRFYFPSPDFTAAAIQQTESGNGSSWMLLINANIGKHLRLGLRYGVDAEDNLLLGSASLITEDSWKLQLRYDW